MSEFTSLSIHKQKEEISRTVEFIVFVVSSIFLFFIQVHLEVSGAKFSPLMAKMKKSSTINSGSYHIQKLFIYGIFLGENRIENYVEKCF